MGLEPTFVLVLLGAAVIFQLLAAALWARVIRHASVRWPWVFLAVGFITLAATAGTIIAYRYNQKFVLHEELTAILLSIAGVISAVSGYYLPPRIIKEIQDLTEAQRTRDLFKAIFDGLPNPAVVKDTALKYLAVNPAFAGFLGKDRDTIQGETDAAFFPRSQSHQFNQADQKVILSGRPASTETEVQGREGRRWLRFDRIPLGGNEGDPDGILVHTIDLTEQKKAEFNRNQELDELRKLNKTTRNLLTQLEMTDLQKRILEEAVALTGIPNAGFAIPEDDGNRLTIKTGVGALAGATDLKFALEEDVAGKVWQSGQPLEINDYPNWHGRSPQFRSFNFGTLLGVPIRIGAEVVAVLMLAQGEGHTSFADGVLSQIQELAKISASLLRNAKAMASVRRFSDEQVEQVRSLRYQARFEHLLAAVASHFINLPPDKISQGVRQALQAIGKLINADRSYLYLYPELNYPGDHIITWEADKAETFSKVLSTFQPSRFPWWIGKLTRSETVHVHDPDSLPPEASALADFLKEQGIQSFTTVPLIAERSVAGFLGFDVLKDSTTHSSEVLKLLEAAGETLINALTRAREAQKQVVNIEELADRVKMLEQHNREHALITEMGELLAASRTADESYPIVARYTERLIPIGSGTLYTLENPEDPAQPAASWGEVETQVAELALNECWALRRGRAHLVTDPESGPNCHHLATPYPASYLCVPLIAQGEAGGLLHFSLPDEPAGGKSLVDYQPLAVVIAEHIALALSNLSLRDRLRSQAIRDPLTGLFNRRYMEETLVRELRRASRQQTSVGVIMFDIDGLKPINDTHGHDAGDFVLRSLGRLMIKMFRGEDVPCRFGGDEFTLILPEASLADTWQRAEHLREAFKNMPLEHEGKPLNPVTMSIGAVAFPDHGETAEELVQAGDMAAYMAKGEGGDRVMLGKSNDG